MENITLHKLRSTAALFVASILLAGGYLLDFIDTKQAAAQSGTSSGNVSGYAWSENIGWISFNSANDGALQPYGVTIDATTGDFSGFAWSENIGWISFNRSETGNPPGEPYASGVGSIAHYNETTNAVTGWARVLSAKDAGLLRAGGWDGWIKFAKYPTDTGPDYGVTINNIGKFDGFAWGSDVVGWIDMMPSVDTGVVVVNPPPPSPSCPGGQTLVGVDCICDNTGNPPVADGSCPTPSTASSACDSDGKCEIGETLLMCPKDCKPKIQQF